MILKGVDVGGGHVAGDVDLDQMGRSSQQQQLEVHKGLVSCGFNALSGLCFVLFVDFSKRN